MSREVFQSTGFCDWKNAMGSKRGALTCHHNSEAHKTAEMKAVSYLSIIEGTSQDINSCLSEAHKRALKENIDTLMSIIDVVIALGKRNIPFRGNWDKESKREDGNLNFFCSLEV